MLKQGVAERTAKVGVIGLGYVGLPLVKAFNASGFQVIGFDVDRDTVALLQSGRSYNGTVPSNTIRKMIESGRFRATVDFADIETLGALLVCAPPRRSRHTCAPGQFVFLESPTYPGTTTELLRSVLERGGLKSGSDFFIAHSPEREYLGNLKFETAPIPKVVDGDGPAAAELAGTLYTQIVTQVISVSSLPTAEAIKLAQNVFRAAIIALVKQLNLIYEKMRIDVREVVDAAKTKPFGFMRF